MRILAAIPAMFLMSVPALGQDHGEHGAHEPEGTQADAPADRDHSEHGSMDRSAMDHGATEHSEMDHAPPQEPADHGSMDHHSMDHAPGDQDPADHESMDHGEHEDDGRMDEIPQAPPPPEAYEGPAHAADAFVGPEIMAGSRDRLAREVSGMPLFWLQGDRVEYRARAHHDGYLWDLQGFYGGDIDKFWFKSEGEGSFGEEPESAEVQGLWSHAIDPWWDLQLGVRQDLVGPARTHAVIGIQGLAPYFFEVDAAAFVSSEGDVTARIEAELDQRITQRLILQPRAEIALSAQDIPELGMGSGLDRIELGLRLRYEFAREFAPYIGVEQEWLIGGSADYARAAKEDPSVTNYVIGVRFWF